MGILRGLVQNLVQFGLNLHGCTASGAFQRLGRSGSVVQAHKLFGATVRALAENVVISPVFLKRDAVIVPSVFVVIALLVIRSGL